MASSLRWKWGVRVTLTPWCACTTAGQLHGCCSHTHCHTCNTGTDCMSFKNTNTAGNIDTYSSYYQDIKANNSLFGDSPGNEFDEVVIKGNASTSIKDRGVGITDKVRGDNLRSTHTHRETESETHKHYTGCHVKHKHKSHLFKDFLPNSPSPLCIPGFPSWVHVLPSSQIL